MYNSMKASAMAMGRFRARVTLICVFIRSISQMSIASQCALDCFLTACSENECTPETNRQRRCGVSNVLKIKVIVDSWAID
jgi:hypothetical protein